MVLPGCYVMSGTDLGYDATRLRAAVGSELATHDRDRRMSKVLAFAMSGTGIGHAAMRRCLMPGTDMSYAATGMLRDVWY
eukprot:1085378-Rhodomonas_salina.3